MRNLLTPWKTVLFCSTGWIWLQQSANLISLCRPFRVLWRFWHHFCAQMARLVTDDSIRRFAYRLKGLHVARYYVGRTAFDRWQGAARSVWLRTSQLLAAFAAILPFRVSFVTGSCTTGDGVFMVSWKRVDWLYFSFFLLGHGLTGMSHMQNCVEGGRRWFYFFYWIESIMSHWFFFWIRRETVLQLKSRY